MIVVAGSLSPFRRGSGVTLGGVRRPVSRPFRITGRRRRLSSHHPAQMRILNQATQQPHSFANKMASARASNPARSSLTCKSNSSPPARRLTIRAWAIYSPSARRGVGSIKKGVGLGCMIAQPRVAVLRLKARSHILCPPAGSRPRPDDWQGRDHMQ